MGSDDPISQSYKELVEGIRLFHERFNIRDFIESYQEIMEDWKQDSLIELLEKNNCSDKLILRARTFILACIMFKN